MGYILKDFQNEIIRKVDENFNKNNNNILVYSPPRTGKTVMMSYLAKRYTDQGKRVLFTVNIHEVQHDAWKTFNAMGVNMDLVTITSSIKVTNRMKRGETDPDDYAIIFIDEGHHGKSGTFMRIRNYFHPEHFMYFTGTPTRADGQGFDDVADEMVLGPSVRWLIDNNYLADFDYYTIPMADESKLKTSSNGDYTEDSAANAVANVDPQKVVDEYRKYGDGRQGIVYAARVNKSQEIADCFNTNGIKAAHIGGDTPQNVREELVRQYKAGELQVISNVGVFTEGVDLPSAEVEIILRPTKSLSLYLQYSMRVLTQYGENKRATIIDLVGAALQLGLPDYEHQWTLAPSSYEENPYTLHNTMNICPHCNKTYYGEDARVQFKDDTHYEVFCPYCDGFIYDAELPEIEPEEVEDFLTANPEIAKVKSHEEFTRKIYGRKQLSSNHDFKTNFMIAYVKNGGMPEASYKQAAHLIDDIYYREYDMRYIGEKYNISQNLIERSVKAVDSNYWGRLFTRKFTFSLTNEEVLQRVMKNCQFKYMKYGHNIGIHKSIEDLKTESLANASDKKKFNLQRVRSLNFIEYMKRLKRDDISDRTYELAKEIGVQFYKDFDPKQIELTITDLQNYRDATVKAEKAATGPDIFKAEVDGVSVRLTRTGTVFVSLIVKRGKMRYYMNSFSEAGGNRSMFKFYNNDYQKLIRHLPSMRNILRSFMPINDIPDAFNSILGIKKDFIVVNEKYHSVEFYEGS